MIGALMPAYRIDRPDAACAEVRLVYDCPRCQGSTARFFDTSHVHRGSLSAARSMTAKGCWCAHCKLPITVLLSRPAVAGLIDVYRRRVDTWSAT